MSRLPFPLLLAGVLALGCTHAGEAKGGKLQSAPIPPDLQTHVEEARKLGRAMYEQDIVSAKATDVLLAANLLPGNGRVQGWVTRQWPDGWIVDFLAMNGDTATITYRVRFKPDGSTPELTDFEPSLPADEETAAMYRARQNAIAALPDRCTQAVNPVILPGELIGKKGWLVYVLASTTEPGVLILGGHVRLFLSQDGQKVQENFPLYERCMALEMDQAAFAAFISHRRTDWPLESHVFTSLLYSKPIFVRTARGLWKIEADQIDYYGTPEL